MESDPTNALQLHRNSNEPRIRNYFNLEVQFMMNPDFSEEKKKWFNEIRTIAIPYIVKFTSDQPDYFVCCRAITFVDQFLSKRNEIPVVCGGQGFERNVELFAFSCVSLALRLRFSDFSFKKFLNKHGFAEMKDVLLMENRILRGLDFQVRPVTAITFMYFFFSLVMTKDQRHSSLFNLVPQLIVAMQKDMRFTEFRPSTLAASAILVTSYKLYAVKDVELWNKILKSGCVESEVNACFAELKGHDITDGVLKPVKHPSESKLTHSLRSAGKQNKGKGLLTEDSAAENVTGQEPDFEITEEIKEPEETVMHFDSSKLDPKEIHAGDKKCSPIVNSLLAICNCLGCDFGSARLRTEQQCIFYYLT